MITIVEFIECCVKNNNVEIYKISIWKENMNYYV